MTTADISNCCWYYTEPDKPSGSPRWNVRLRGNVILT